MKEGKIVVKGTCEELISRHGRSTLEGTFLKIARGNQWDGIRYMVCA